MSSILWFIFALWITLICIPPLGKLVLGRPISLLIALCASKYIESTLCLYYDIFTGTWSIEGLGLKPAIRTLIDASVPLPIHWKRIYIDKIRLTGEIIKAWLSGEQIEAVKLEIIGIHLVGTFVGRQVWSRAEVVERELEKLAECRQLEANIITQAIQQSLNRTAAYSLTKVQVILDQLLDHLQVNISAVLLHLFHEDDEALDLTLSSLTISPKAKQAQVVTRHVELKELALQAAEQKVIHFPLVSGEVTLPSVFAVLLCPKPSILKTLDVSIGIEHLGFGVSPSATKELMNVMDKLQDYSSFMAHIALEAERNAQDVLDAEKQQYFQLYDPNNESTEEVNALEKKWTVETIISLRSEKLEWENKIKQDVSSHDKLMAYAEEQQASQGMFRQIDLTVSFSYAGLSLCEDGDLIGEFGLAEIDVVLRLVIDPTLKKTSDPFSLELSINRIYCTIQYECLGCPESPLIRHDATRNAFHMSLTTKSDQSQSITGKIVGVQFLLLAKPLEILILYIDRLSKRSTPSVPTIESDKADDVVTETTTASTDLSLFGAQSLDVSIHVADLGVCIGANISPTTKLPRADVLELVMSGDCIIHSRPEKESVDLLVPEIALLHRVIEHESESGIIVRASTENSLMEPLNIKLSYTHQVTAPEGNSDATKCLKKVSMLVPDIVISFSHMNLAIVVGGLSDLSAIQTTTPEQLQQHQEFQARMEKRRKERELKTQLAAFEAAFKFIDKDQSGSIDKDELIALLRSTTTGTRLLLSELATLGESMFAMLDENGQGEVSFSDFVDYIRRDMQNHRLSGHLNLRCGEYVCQESICRLLGEHFTNMNAVFTDTKLREKFWEVYVQQVGVTKNDLGGQALDVVQKKLVRLVRNFTLAEACWNRLISPALHHAAEEAGVSFKYNPWILQGTDTCGGLCEFESISTLVLVTEESSSQAEVLQRFSLLDDTDNDIDTLDYNLSLSMESDIHIGNVRVLLQDTTLPAGTSRAELMLSDTKCFAALVSNTSHDAKDGIFQRAESEWSATFGCKLQAWCFTEAAGCDESIIEPWKLGAAIASNDGEEGFTLLLETEQRLQVNATAALMHSIKLITAIVHGTISSEENEHEKALVDSVSRGLHISNFTGVDVRLHFDASEDPTVIENDSAVTFHGAKGSVEEEVKDDEMVVHIPDEFTLEIPGWGTAKDVKLGNKTQLEFRVYQDCDTDLADRPYIPIICRKATIPEKGCSLVLKSNVSIANNTGGHLIVKVLYNSTILEVLRDRAEEDFTLALPPGHREPLPLEIYTCNSDLVVIEKNAISKRLLRLNPSQLKDLSSSSSTASDQEVATNIARIPLISDVYLMSRESSFKESEWEICIYPQLVLRNSLPYSIEYSFLEIDPKSTPTALDKIDSVQKVQDLLFGQSSRARRGKLSPGSDVEVDHLTLPLAYVAFRVVGHSIKTSGNRAKNDQYSEWSQPILMDISGTIEQFTTLSRVVGVGRDDYAESVAVDGISLPGWPRLLRFMTPYWIINNTGMPLEFATEKGKSERKMPSLPRSPREFMRKKKEETLSVIAVSDAFASPYITHLVSDRLAIRTRSAAADKLSIPQAWSSYKNVKHSSDNIVADGTSWSEMINASAVNTTGELVTGDHVYSISISATSNRFQGSKVVKIGPRYIVHNKTGISIQFKSFSATPEEISATTNSGALNFIGNQAKKALRFYAVKDDPTFSQQHALLSGTVVDHGEHAVVNCVKPLNTSTDSTAESSRYMIVSMYNDKWKTSKWSYGIPISDIGDFHCDVRNMETGAITLIQVSVVALQEHIYIILTDSSQYPPYRVENITSYPLIFRRYHIEGETRLEPGEWSSFSWNNPLQRDRQIEVTLETERKKDERTWVQYDIEHIGDLKSTHAKTSRGEMWEVAAEVYPEQSTRVLRLVDYQADEVGAAVKREHANEAKQFFASSVDIRLSGIGFSLFNSKPHEVLFASIDFIKLTKKSGSFQWEFEVFHAQIDNMLRRQKFPVLLEPQEAGYASPSGEKRPCIKIKVESTLSETVLAYELLEINLSPLSLKLDIDFLITVIGLFDELLVPIAALDKDNTEIASELVCQRLPFPMRDSTGSLLYIELFHIESTALNVEWLLRQGTIDQSSSYMAVQFIMSVISLIGSNLSGSPTLSFDEIVIHQCFTSTTSLLQQLSQNYTRQAILQAYRVLGSSDILGDPIGLVENLGSGVAQFMRITKDEIVGDAGTRGEGIKVLGKTIVRTGATTAAKITGSLDRLVGDFTSSGDKAPDSAPLSGASDDDYRGTGLKLTAGTTFAKNFGREIAGIVKKPIAGAKKSGVTGLVKGTVQGIMGPGVACLKAVTAASHNIASGVEATMIDRAPFKGRRRNPKKFIDGRLVLQTGVNDLPNSMTVHLIGAKGLVARKSCDPCCFVYIDNEKKYRTKVMYNTVNPAWNETKLIPLKGSERMIRFSVKDSYGGAVDTVIGNVTLPLKQFVDDFSARGKNSPLMQWVETGERPSVVDPNVAQEEKQRAQREYELLGMQPRAEHKDHMHVVVTVLEAEGLGSSSGVLGYLSSSDPYVTVALGGVKQRTTCKASGKKPKWMEEFAFPVRRPKTPVRAELTFSVKEKGMLTDETVGRGKLLLDLDGEHHVSLHKWIQLKHKDSDETDAGSLQVKVETLDAYDASNVSARVGKLTLKAEF